MLGFIISTARKIIILTSLKDKVAEYRQSTDVHIKTESGEISVETFITNDMHKLVLNYRTKNLVLTQIEDYNMNEQRTYFDSGEIKSLDIKKDVSEFMQIIPMYTFADSQNLLETIVNSVNSKIYTEDVDGMKCYVIESTKNTNFGFSGEPINGKGYVNKETGLKVKFIETVENYGEISDKVTTYEYSFDKIPEEDLQEPDRNEYEIRYIE